MLTLTQTQMDAFDAMQILRFKDTMLAHFAEHFPDETNHIDEQIFSQFIIDGIREAHNYDIESNEHVCTFLNIKVLLKISTPFGGDNHRWIVNILRDKSIGRPEARVDKLAEVTDAYLANAMGGKHQ